MDKTIAKGLLAVAGALLCLASACEKTTEESGETLFYASMDESRTALSYPSLLWTAGDAICVNGKTSGSAKISDGGRSA